MPAGTPPRTVVRLGEVARSDRERVGSKAANLGELLRAGFPVPNGVVVLGAGDADPNEILQLLGNRPVAARSSAVAEDLGGVPDAVVATLLSHRNIINDDHRVIRLKGEYLTAKSALVVYGAVTQPTPIPTVQI